MVQTQLKTRPCRTLLEVELEGNEVNPWPYIHALLCSVSCVCLGRPNLQHLDIALRKHVEVR